MISRPDRQEDRRKPRPETRAAQTGPVDMTVLVARLTERDRWILRMLHEHRVLTTNQLAALAFTNTVIALRRLNRLHRYGVLERFRPLRTRGSAPMHWVLAPPGASVLAAEVGISVRELGYNHQRTLAIAHSLHLTHTLGVNTWFTTLTAHAPHDERGQQARVQAWWSQTRCQRLWGDLARPDAFGRYTLAEATLDFFLEYDLASTTLTRVAAKLHGYSELARTTGIPTPVLLWTPTTMREANARTALRQTWQRLPDPEAVPVATAAAELLTPKPEASPADQVWLPLDRDSDRLRLHELATVWPGRTPPADELHSEQNWAPSGGLILLAPPPPTPPLYESW
ncbi:replication-relaxation family protein [Nocardia sienata]|uniref:replication-relaxation family protein n=1 Tax=Nocardia sienata TaxID=248552 RepID=UPI000A001056|nr:replication-relaxation family protein [Nocardia sienata]